MHHLLTTSPHSGTQRCASRRFRRLPLALAIAATLASSAVRADEAALKAEIAELRAQIAEMKAQMKEIAAQNKAASTSTTAAMPAPAPAQTDIAARVDRLEQTVATQAEASSETTLFGYGEITYNRPTHAANQTQADLARAVLGWSHRFDERTRMAAEFEVEHAVASADDSGEAEIEQFYVERQFTDRVGGRAGLMLVPIGLLNEHHEPTQYYSVFRNLVETAIIPTTWREGGLALYGGTDSGLHWNVGVTTGFNLAKWDPSSNEGRESPLGSIHQELQQASARDLSQYVSVNYDGVPGLQLGGTVFTGKAGQGTEDFAAPNARITLWEAHARWQPGPFDLSALYSRGTISDTEALNLTFVGQPTPVPKDLLRRLRSGVHGAMPGPTRTIRSRRSRATNGSIPQHRTRLSRKASVSIPRPPSRYGRSAPICSSRRASCSKRTTNDIKSIQRATASSLASA